MRTRDVCLLLFLTIYGFLFVNIIDTYMVMVFRYYVYITFFSYLVPPILILIINKSYWKKALVSFLYVWLLNDLTAPIIIWLSCFDKDLLGFYVFTLGLKGLELGWYYELGFVRIPITSITMGISTYVRLFLMTLLKKS